MFRFAPKADIGRRKGLVQVAMFNGGPIGFGKTIEQFPFLKIGLYLVEEIPLEICQRIFIHSAGGH